LRWSLSRDKGRGDDCEPAGLVDNKNTHTFDALKNESMIIIPVFVVIGLELPFECEDDPDDIEYEKFMFNIPLKDAKHAALYESVFAKF
jgi:hypothetical protein